MRRPFVKDSIGDLEVIFEKNQNVLNVLRKLEAELQFRKTARALKLQEKVQTSLRHTETRTKPIRKFSPVTPENLASLLTPGVVSPLPVTPMLPTDTTSKNPDQSQRILSAWTALEVLSPQSFKRPQDLAAGSNPGLVALFDHELPWEGTRYKAKPNTQLYYQVILGTISLEKATSKLLDLYGDNRIEKPALKGDAIIAVAVVNKNGILVQSPAVALSSFSWGVPQALTGKLDNLNQWGRIEPGLVENLEKILRRYDPEGNEQPLSGTVLSDAYNHLVNSLELSPDLVKKNQFAICTFEYYKNLTPPEPLLLNSFFLGDLEYAGRLIGAGQGTANLKKYLGITPPLNRFNIKDDNTALKQAVSPEMISCARWPGPGRHPLVLLQQAAVNLALRELRNEGIIAVNGPPGTGKTTLLRDVVSGLVARRAEAMCAFDDPETAFSHSGQKMKAGQGWWNLYQINPSLKGFEMLIASSNNKAVENVSAELPAIKAIADDATDLRYFKTVSDALIGGDSWGLIAAVLGNAANRNRFRQTFWWDEETGLSTYLAEIAGTPQWLDNTDPHTSKVNGSRKPRIITSEKPPANHIEALQRWRTARESFQHARKKVQQKIDEVTEAERCYSSLEQLQHDNIVAERNLSQIVRSQKKIEDAMQLAKGTLEKSVLAVRVSRLGLQSHQAMKPNWFLQLINSRSAKNWRSQEQQLFSTFQLAEKEHADNTNRLTVLEKKIVTAKISYQKCTTQSRIAQKKLTEARQKIAYYKQTLGKNFVDEEFFALSHADRHKAAPWQDGELLQLRDEVFISSMRLHKAFVDAAAKPLRHNLGALMQVFTGLAMTDPAKLALLPDLWSSLFLIIPCISTTFASVERMLGPLPPESLGWLLIDEAGQALPQAAVGALIRTKRAIVVGDPIQIEPVVVLPQILTRAICKSYHIETDQYNAPEASVQTLADAASSYFTEFTGKTGSRTVGIPLLVHRRCEEPMFGISNAIGYGNLMVQAKQPGRSPIRECLGESCWFDVKGQAVEKWCPEEGNLVLELLQKLKVRKVKPELYIITPFVIIAENLRALLKRSELLQDWVPEPDRWVYDRIGTVHTVQGRETEAVIFVLGAQDIHQTGARAWASAKPNLLNVAVTRAREVLYVVGNHQLWGKTGVFAELEKRIEVAIPPQQKSAARGYYDWSKLESAASMMLLRHEDAAETHCANKIWDLLQKSGLTSYTSEQERQGVLVLLLSLVEFVNDCTAIIRNASYEPELISWASEVAIDYKLIIEMAGKKLADHAEDDEEDHIESALDELVLLKRTLLVKTIRSKYLSTQAICEFIGQNYSRNDDEELNEKDIEILMENYEEPRIPMNASNLFMWVESGMERRN